MKWLACFGFAAWLVFAPPAAAAGLEEHNALAAARAYLAGTDWERHAAFIAGRAHGRGMGGHADWFVLVSCIDCDIDAADAEKLLVLAIDADGTILCAGPSGVTECGHHLPIEAPYEQIIKIRDAHGNAIHVHEWAYDGGGRTLEVEFSRRGR
jgi:hypothetical protein